MEVLRFPRLPIFLRFFRAVVSVTYVFVTLFAFMVSCCAFPDMLFLFDGFVRGFMILLLLL